MVQVHACIGVCRGAVGVLEIGLNLSDQAVCTWRGDGERIVPHVMATCGARDREGAIGDQDALRLELWEEPSLEGLAFDATVVYLNV